MTAADQFVTMRVDTVAVRGHVGEPIIWFPLGDDEPMWPGAYVTLDPETGHARLAEDGHEGPFWGALTGRIPAGTPVNGRYPAGKPEATAP